MPRADLRNALVLDREIYEASRVDPTLLDPVVRVEGALPASARPLVVVRDYQGPQGIYVEHFVIADRRGREIVSSRPRPIRLAGEMFSDRIETTLDGVILDDFEEHEATFYLGEEAVGSIPVFIEPAADGDPRIAAEETFKKALQKGAVVWLTVPQPGGGQHTQPVWFVYTDGKVYVLTGPTEQQVPHLADVSEIQLAARSKDLRSLVARVTATTRVVPSEDRLFEQVARAGLGKRLNLPDGDGALDRWRANCRLVELTPRFRGPQREAIAAGAAPPGAVAPGAVPPAAADSAPEPGEGAAATAAKAEEDIHVEAQIDQAVFDQLIAEGKPERIARAKAKAAYVRAAKARIRAEREQASA